MKQKKISIRKSIVEQFIYIFLVISAFIISATISPISHSYGLSVRIVSILCFLLSFFVLCLLLFEKYKSGYLTFEYLRKNKYEIIILLIAIFFRAIQLGTKPKWDSEFYFNSLVAGCENFDFSLRSFIEVFRLCAHPTIMYAAITSIGYFLIPGDIVGVQLINLILSIIAIHFVYQILKVVAAGINERIIAFATLVFSFAPMFLGTFSTYTPDFGVAVFFIFVLYFHLKKKYMLMFFYSVCLILTKEIGIILLAGYYSVYCILILFLTSGSCGDRFRKVVTDKTFIYGLCSGMLGAIYYVYSMFLSDFSNWKFSFGTEEAGVVQDTTQMVSNFIYNFSYIITKLKTLVILNFSWILFILLLISCLVIIKRKLLKRILFYKEMVAICGSMIFFCVFTFLYITYNNSRYHLVYELCLFLLSLSVIIKLFGKRKEVLILLIGLCFIFGLEAYTTVDPLTKIFFDRIESGSRLAMVTTNWEGHSGVKADVTVYNHQFTYLDKAYDAILEKEYSSDKDIIVWGPYSETKAVAIEGIEGKFVWNFKDNKRECVANENTEAFNIVYEEEFEEMLKNDQLNEEAILICTPQFGNYVETAKEVLSNYYDIGPQEKVLIKFQGCVLYYKLTLK